MNIWIETSPWGDIRVAHGKLTRAEGKFWPVIDSKGEIYYSPLYRPAEIQWPLATDEDWLFGYVKLGKQFYTLQDIPYYPWQLGLTCPYGPWSGPYNFGPISVGEFSLLQYIPNGNSIFATKPPLSIEEGLRVRMIWIRLGIMSRRMGNFCLGPPSPIPTINRP